MVKMFGSRKLTNLHTCMRQSFFYVFFHAWPFDVKVVPLRQVILFQYIKYERSEGLILSKRKVSDRQINIS